MRRRLDVPRAVARSGVIAPASVLLDDGRVEVVGTPQEVGDVDVERVALTGTLVPGFVDLQVNGFAGHQFAASEGGLAATADGLLRTGVTAICPTITSRALDRYAADVATLGQAPARGPRDLGLHLEGPFLAPTRAGAHDRDVLVPPTEQNVAALLEACGRPVAIVTLAPEVPGAHLAIARVLAAGAVVSAGHTDATFDQLRAAVGQGVSMVTHVFNAQRGLHHRDPGVAGGALLLSGLHVGVILDGHHVHPDLAVHVLDAAAGRVFAVTDAVATAGLPAGVYTFDGVSVDTSDGAPRLEDGTLAGSNLTMDAAFRAVEARRGLGAAVAATATVPAAAIGRPALGVLAPGSVADLVLLDADLRVAGVWRDGERVIG